MRVHEGHNFRLFLQRDLHFHTCKNKNHSKVQNQHALVKDTSSQLMKQQPFPSELVPISQGHAFTEIRGKQPSSEYCNQQNFQLT
jgi:hypothetical protein